MQVTTNPLLADAAALLKVPPLELARRVAELVKETKQLRHELDRAVKKSPAAAPGPEVAE